MNYYKYYTSPENFIASQTNILLIEFYEQLKTEHGLILQDYTNEIINDRDIITEVAINAFQHHGRMDYIMAYIFGCTLITYWTILLQHYKIDPDSILGKSIAQTFDEYRPAFYRV